MKDVTARVALDPSGLPSILAPTHQSTRILRLALSSCVLRQVDRKWAAATLLSSCRGLIFEAVKKPALDGALSATAFREGGQFDLRLSRAKVAS